MKNFALKSVVANKAASGRLSLDCHRQRRSNIVKFISTTISTASCVFGTDAPWCSHCKALAPEFTKLAQLLEEQNSEVRLAKVDATAEKQLAERYEVSGYPTLKLFRPGRETPVECRTEHTAGEMLVWLRKKQGSPVDKVDTVIAAKELIDISIVAVFGFFKVTVYGM